MADSQLSAKQLWSPKSADSLPMKKFMDLVNSKYDESIDSYDKLWDWSVTEIERFWELVLEFTGIIASPWQKVLQDVPMNEIPEWFIGSKLNYAQNILKFRDDRIAIISAGEDASKSVQYTFKQLFTYVEKIAAGLKKANVGVGDVIVAYVPNCPEAVMTMLAAASIGAIWSSASPDFGTLGVLERFGQVKPKILLSVNAVWYNGRVHDHLGKLKQVAQELPTVEKVIVVPFIDQAFDLSGIQNAISWTEFMNSAPDSPLEFEQLPFNHPLVVLYSSGTTGKPKCIVHSAGGILIQHLKEHVIHGSMTRDDVFFYYTTTGWMMWNWLVGSLATGATIVLYDGSPFKPSPMRLWELVDQFGVSIFGTSAKYIQSLLEAKVYPGQVCDLKTLRTIYSTGSPLSPESFDFVYTKIKSDVLLGSITGGTDIVSLFAGHNSYLPVYRGEIQCRCLGMKVEAWDGSGCPIYDTPGDLVCSKPFPVMPVYFWDDPNNEKYKNAYFSEYGGKVWYHGDFVMINSKTGGVHMLGRSDGTLNPSGVRFGSAELYNIIANFPTIQDSLAVGQKIGDDERVVLFCKMHPEEELTQELINQIKTKIRTLLSPRHVPSFILSIGDIPYTLTGKKVEIAVKKILNGENAPLGTALANPESLKLYQNIPELKWNP